MTLTIDDTSITQIVPAILYKIQETVQTELGDNVPDESPTKVVLCKVGRFQDNPIQKNVSVSISGGDFENEKYLDAPIDHEETDQITMFSRLPVREIGGGSYWWRRGSINFQAFFIRERFDEDVAIRHAYDFYGRLMQCIEQINVSGMIDEYGEKSYGYVIPESTSFFESGGAKQYIFRGKLYFRVLTWRP